MLRRTFLGGTAAAAAAPFLPARPALAQGGRASVLRFVPQSDLTIVDPVTTTAYVTRNHALMVFDQLYGLDAQFTPQPQMVEGHTVEEDGRRWTFRLRESLRFHDGEPVRGRDCVASIRRWAQRDSLGQALMARTDALEAPDDRTFVIRLKRPYGLMLETLAKLGPPVLVIMPERLAAIDPAQQIPELIGSGPFRFNAKERLVGARVVYDRNPDYRPREDGPVSWVAGPKRVHFERVEWQVMPDPGTAAAALQNGEVDWWENPISDLVPTLQAHPQIATQLASPLGNLGTGVMNHLYPPFDKPAVRRVVLEALSQADFMAAAAGDDPKLWRKDVGLFTPGTAMATDAGLDVLTRPRDLAKAKRDLVAAGYKGERVVLMSTSENPVLGALGEIMHDLLQRLGMNVQYVVSDWGTLVTRRASKAPPDQGGWNIFTTTWTGLDMANPVVEQVLRCGGEKGFFGWPDLPELESLREAWIEAPDQAARKTIAAKMQTLAMRDVPYLPTGQYFYRTAFRRDLRDVVDGQFVFWNARRA
ncbi:ABC transporter substrate-binding protein (plasmid) [Methylobacterium radiotolerans]|jgi:peptide/nickel transport system substrate-binding protein|uniref:ABC transporter substrate-binding protein n=1 Tax=Methylobacterium TaxID=407 RepID=UPI0005E4F705|nr:MULTISPECIES: ABC transporter substrate-binding protein [Methylobacterium]MBN6819371.1 ABC transporter substrate-binding protein [Methylobacterium organophilum]OXE39451.1 ABC transporter substrate-binding protein [Methylobacterium radiotolerans]GAN48166.1 extracellular solute-binding protein [Methylobacterium sp. ME121]